MRLDIFLCEFGYADSRTRASQMIKEGLVKLDGRIITKPSYEANESMCVELSDGILKYVSRGALKLKGAFDKWSINAQDAIAVDLGASTGGFCEVLLEHGAAYVYAIDIGHGQLHEKIKSNPKVQNIEGVNARDASACNIGQKADIVTSDLSFISQTLTLDTVFSLLKDGGEYISLIKPQFEVGREKIGKNGIVKDRKAHVEAIEKVIYAAEKKGLCCTALIPSPIFGTDGNREFLARFVKSFGKTKFDKKEIEKIANR